MEYTYDGKGKRLQASSGSGAADKTKYLWDPNHALPQLAMERDGSDALRRRYVYGMDLVSMSSGGANYYYHHDPLGSVSNLTSATGAAQWTYAYEPFGSLRTETQHDTNAPTNLMRFTGELFDSDTELYHLRARQYRPSLGRFLATDPLQPTLTDPYVGAYVYANDRPTVLIDPSGMRGIPGWGEDLLTNFIDVWQTGVDPALELGGEVLDFVVKYGRVCAQVGQAGAVAAFPGLFWQGFVGGCIIGMVGQATLEETVE